MWHNVIWAARVIQAPLGKRRYINPYTIDYMSNICYYYNSFSLVFTGD